MIPAFIKSLPPEKLLILVDGSSYLFRAYHAPHLNALTAPDGTMSGAIYGVLTMIRRLQGLLGINAETAKTLQACFVMDEKGGSFRNEWYAPYKANRRAAPDDLVAQIEPLRTLISHLGWSLLSMSGFEADDLIATLTQNASAQGKTTIIVTGDKDLAQLVDDSTFLLDTMKDEWLDAEGVKKKFGIPPSLIIDYLTLIGDSSDNVPGVDKVGPKTAVKWLLEYGSLDRIVDNAEKLTGVVGENLRAARTFLPLSKRLITLKKDVSLPADFSLHFKPANVEALRESYQRWGFKKFLAELTADNHQATIASWLAKPSPLSAPQRVNVLGETEEVEIPLRRLDEKKFETIDSMARLQAWINLCEKASLLSIDTETTGLNPHQDRLIGISLSLDGANAGYIPLGHTDQASQLPLETVLSAIAPILANDGIKKCGHHLRFDRHLFAQYGLSLRGICHDTALAGFVLEGHLKNGLADIARRWLGLEGMSFDEAVAPYSNKKNFAEVPINVATVYAGEDAAMAWLCAQFAEQRLSTTPSLKKLYEMELAVSEVLFAMESCGIRINAELLREYSVQLSAQCQALEQEAQALAGVAFNVASTQQLQEVLFHRLKLSPIKKTQKGAASTNEEVLEALADEHPIAQVILHYRACAKLNNTYAKALPQAINPRTGRIHTRFSQVGAITGRLASTEPNVQNIPVKTPEGRKIRTAFIPQEGWQLISADYSQIELRVMAHFAGDDNMMNAFAQGADIHRKTASEVFHIPEEEVSPEQRRYAKAINFGLIYGMSAFGLAKAIRVDRGTAQRFIDRYFERYHAVRVWMDGTLKNAAQSGFVETLGGRRITIQGINSPNAIARQAAGRFAINAPIQGSAADVIKLAMIEVQHWLLAQKVQAKMLLQVHDELVLECPKEELALLSHHLPILMRTPEQALSIRVPLEVNVGVGDNWDAAH